MGRGERAGSTSKNSSRGQVWKRNVKCDDSDEDYMLEEDDQSDELESLVGDASDEESLGDFVDEEEVIVRNVVRSKSQKRSMGRTKNGIRSSKKRKRVEYDEDDEDYDDDDEFTPDELDLLVGDVSDEESLGSFVDEEDEDEIVKKVVRSKSQKKSTGKVKNGIRSSKKRRRVGYDEDDEDFDDEFTPDELESLAGDASDEESLGDFVEEEEIVTNDVRSKSQKRSMGRRTSGIRSSKKRKRVRYDEEDEDYEDGDDDDDEFIPDELDFLDEEGLTSPTGKNKKKAQCSPKKKGSVKIQERNSGLNPPRRPQKKNRRGRSKSSRRKRMPVHGKKKAMPHSDSDFVTSESSDDEFMISEEELEQVREASEYCRRLSSNLRSSKKDGEDATHYQLRKLSTSKGKEKVEERKNNVGKQVCGICLTEEGKNTTRGTLNCCSHFFCFGCIIEWSKVESRCPLCKQRFSTIGKPARSSTGIDLRDVVTHIPERDQVYQPSEEELRDYLIAYENVICSECHEGGDEALMLLCDLCDSPAHTYCVGLGREVPEGSWYCEGCRPSAIGFMSPRAQEDLTPAFNDPSVLENIAEIDLNITIPEMPRTPVNQLLVSPRQPSGEGLQSAAPVSGMGVSTVSGRRSRAHRLQYLLSSNRLIHTGMRVDRSSTPDRWIDFSDAWED